MPTYICSDDSSHVSTDPQVCTVCGALMEQGGGSSPAPSPPPPPAAASPSPSRATGTGAVCANCGVPRVPGDLFCENCGIDFATGSLDIPDAAPAPSPPPPPAAAVVPADAPPPAPVASGVAATMEVLVTIDTTGKRERPDDAVPPADPGPRIYLLDTDRLLIGRGSNTIRPNIVVKDDPGVSRGHAEILKDADGYSVRDLDSANGTSVNGQALSGQELRPLKVGDTIELGFWQLLTIRARP